MTRPHFCLLRCVLVAAGLLVSRPAASDAVQSAPIDITAFVQEASSRHGIPAAWIYAVMRAESAGHIGAVSSAGAMGLMQLMPATWAHQRARLGLGADPFNPRDNIFAGTSYLREMLDRYGAAGFLAAYNAGPGRYEQWRDHARPLPAETRAYVAKVTALLQQDSHVFASAPTGSVLSLRITWTRSQLFTEHSPASQESGGLFVPVSESRAQ